MRDIRPQLIAAVFAMVCISTAIWQLERERFGLTIIQFQVGTTPVTVYRSSGGAKAPAVVIAHGFAGSRQLMEAFALTLTHAGYVAVSFDFEGHGRNPTPMSGNVAHVEGTTRLLSLEVGRVIDATLALPGVDGRVALLGHSMASDIIVRRAIQDPRVSATVGISMYSEAVTASAPRNLLIVSGEWETFLRQDALRNVRLAHPAAAEGVTAGDPSKGSGRRAAVGPGVEHVGILYSAAALHEARAWLDAVFERTSSSPVSATGVPIILLLLGLVVLAWPLSRLLPRGERAPAHVPLRTYLLAVVVPAMATPILLSLVETRFIPVLVADYLAAHLLIYGLVAIGILAWRGIRFGHIGWISALALAGYGILVFGSALDRYVASFWPIPSRLPIIAAIAVGALTYMLADGLITEAGRAALWRVLAARGTFIASLGYAVALDTKRLFFLLIIIPIIVLFFTTFGLMSGWVGRRSGSPSAVGIGLGLILAWALGVSFPMFAPA